MNSVEMDQTEKKSEEASDAELILSDASDPNGLFDIPLVEPRVGEEYQAEIPQLLTQSQPFELSADPIESEAAADAASRAFLMGLPMPIMWICNEGNASKDEHKKIVHDPSDATCFSHLPVPKNDPKTDSCFFVPGLSPESWNDFEVESFILGLYIFGKNLLQVERFMESKDTGQIQCFYYGRFYKSPRYWKWVDCRKMRNKRCIMGIKIFSGCRQQELLSRLLPHLSEQAKNTFQEISNALVEERTSLEDYVSTLKEMVGIRVLVEAVGIGKGKEDLTTLITENSKTGQRQRVRAPELPSGKACSSLNSADIIKFLTSDIRLSKARSNDLFWEAVWPRLLAKGWHSEQPNDIWTAPKNNLVFLMPGIKKFSRRKLMNGTHFFDSVSDVLRKVASEPRLLDLEVEEGKPENSKEENSNSSVDCVDDYKDKDRPRFLKPQAAAKVMKFTVIDTSSPSKVRVLRSLPPREKHSSKSRKNGTHLLGDFNMKSSDNGDVSPKVKAIKHKKCGGSNHSGPVTKRQRLTACEFTNKSLIQDKPVLVLSLPASTDKKEKVSPSPYSLEDEKISVERDQQLQPESLGQRQILWIDLNLPHVPMEPEADESASGQCDITCKHEPTESSEEIPSVSVQSNKPEPMESSTGSENASGRRLSTRTRPLTTKALEALEIGLLSLRQSKKRAAAGSLDRKTRLSRQARSDEASYGETGSDGLGDGKMDVVTSPLVQNNETAWPVNC